MSIAEGTTPSTRDACRGRRDEAPLSWLREYAGAR